MQELRIALQPKQRLFAQSIENFPVSGFGGAKGGGKSHALRNILLLRRFQYPGSIGRIFRRTFPELQDNHIDPLMRQFPDLRPYYNDSKKTLYLPNGSVLHFNHCQNEKDVFLYQGRETHDLGIDQAEQWTHQMVSILMGSNRSSVPGVAARAAWTFNPGDIGHAWLKRLFILKRYNPGEIPEDYNFIQALVDDNHALMANDPNYVRRLEAEPNEALRRAYRWGDWDIFAGQFFQEISREHHLVKDFAIPPHWGRFGAYDFGFNHPAAFGWFAVDSDGNVYLYRIKNQAKTYVETFAKELKKYDDTADLYPIVAGHDCWAKKAVMKENNPPTIAEEFAKHDIILKRATIDRVPGATQLRSYLQLRDHPSGTKKPRFFIFESCMPAYECLARMIHDPDNVEDVLKVDATQSDPETGDDLYDMIRYGLMTRPPINEEPKTTYPWGTPERAQADAEEMEEKLREHLERQEQPETGYGLW